MISNVAKVVFYLLNASYFRQKVAKFDQTGDLYSMFLGIYTYWEVIFRFGLKIIHYK